VKGLSPEIRDVGADIVQISGKQNAHNRNRRGCEKPTGSKTVCTVSKGYVETWETQYSPCNKFGVCYYKSINDKEWQMLYWGSDKFIVAMKQSNVCGAKGLTGKRWVIGTHLPDTELDNKCQQNYCT